MAFMNKLVISGRPASGKTTFIKSLIDDIKEWQGFYTQEIRIHGKRVGFEIITSTGEKRILAHVDIDSKYRVSKYGVDISVLDDVVSEILIPTEKILFIDEIGKMEVFSEKFVQRVESLFTIPKQKIIATTRLPLIPFIKYLSRKVRFTIMYIKDKESIIEHIKKFFL